MASPSDPPPPESAESLPAADPTEAPTAEPAATLGDAAEPAKATEHTASTDAAQQTAKPVATLGEPAEPAEPTKVTEPAASTDADQHTAKPAAPTPGVLRRLGRHLSSLYLEADPRGLALFRVLLGALLCFDVLRRFPNVFAFYANTGWLPNHAALFRPASGHLFSVYHLASTPGEVQLLLLLHLACAVSLMVGWHTRLMQVLCLVLTTSLNSRNVALESGGWVMVNLIAVWSVFLPLGRRFSVDAVLTALRAREPSRQLTPEQAQARWPIGVLPPRSRLPVRSLAVLAILLQWALVYYFNAVHKVGPSWQNGDAIYYFIHQDRLTHGLGTWLRELLPLSATRAMTHSALAIEFAIPALLLLPFAARFTRPLAWALGIALHLGIAAFAALGPFVWVMMVPYPLFIVARSWDRLAAFVAARRPRVEVRVADSPGGASLGRLVLALNGLERCQVTSSAEERSVSARIHDASGSSAWLTGGRALYLISGGWTAPRFLWLVLCLPGVRSAVGLLLQRLADGGPLERTAPRPLPRAGLVRRALGWAAQGVIALLMVAAASQVLAENRAIPKRLKPAQRPQWLMAIIEYPRLFQGWSMFAPDPPREDGRVIIDGRTADGRKLDPFTGEAPVFQAHRPAHVPNDSDWSAFHMRIPEARYANNYPYFRQLLLHYHEHTGRPEDRLVAFEVWYGSRHIPPPGEAWPPPRYRLLFRHGQVNDPGVPREHVGRGDTSNRVPNRPPRLPTNRHPE
ncbi:MAG: HTTM domain-containing protein [Polyangiaceae bacterium]|nr:HTTM domain-containing protein [Polyangiaceae bacterium]MCW5792620.1 HTTM domain-containing protein [Polyangiaceae bacterium]